MLAPIHMYIYVYKYVCECLNINIIRYIDIEVHQKKKYIYICIHPRLFQVESQELQKLQACGLCKWDQMYGNFEGFLILILQCVWDCGSIIYDP